MKIGVCTGIDNSKLLADEGYDYIELGLSAITNLSESEFEAYKNTVENSRLKPYAFNVFLPKDMKVVGPEADDRKIIQYVSKAIGRAGLLGGKIIAFGSGASRNIPDGFPRSKAFDQLVSFLRIAARAAEEKDITLAIEPLRSAETNIINTAAEGLELAREVNHPNVKLLVDFYHMSQEDEKPEVLLEAGFDYIKHIHIAAPKDRSWPLEEGGESYRQFFHYLKEIGYTGGISIEGRTSDLLKDAPLAMACLKNLINQ
jgi:sugar phosphate isomerase/epimerase